MWKLQKWLKAGSVANILSAGSWKSKHMKTTSQSKGEKEETVVVKRVSEEKAGDFINFFKMLEIYLRREYGRRNKKRNKYIDEY